MQVTQRKQTRSFDWRKKEVSHKKAQKAQNDFLVSFVSCVPFCGLVRADHLADAAFLFLGHLGWSLLGIAPVVENADLMHAL